jgi:uncharacterized protein YegJ (DUF2314 family)
MLISVKSDDEKMVAAINSARKSLKQFLDAFFAPKPNQKHFLLKVAFHYQEETEHIWLADLDLASTPVTGVVANEPKIPTLEYMQRVPFNASDITDWMYYEDENLVGGFTSQVLQASKRPN